MEDRLSELQAAGGVKLNDKKKKKGKGKGKVVDEESQTTSDNGNIEMEETGYIENEEGEGMEEFMPEFYQEVGIVKTTMTSIRRSIKSIEEKYVQSLNSINVDQGTSIQKTLLYDINNNHYNHYDISIEYEEDIQSMIDATNRSFSDLKKKLDSMKEGNDRYASVKTATPTEVRIRSNMHNTLTQKFVEMMREYQEIQNNYKNKYKEKIERQYRIVKPDASEDEIRAAMDSGDSSKIFADTILYTHLHTQAKNALAYIQDRHNDIQRLERSIAELHQLFLDMAVLVEVQGEILNQIEANVESTVLNTKEGVENLAEANRLHKKGRKKMYILLCIVVIVLAAVLAPVLATQIPKKSNN
ncbi:t-SNARE family protein [Cavenderia fasciculata]|uniref:t-SNARE family protein n=1 Tax=Cavenderia fasciculata TaxID=261658 RepID=F4QDI5_CACFS|nr:t-SNARE family protein [Cavenderia fasciculata]EGG13782.1 t-SNARE family protein [Cavenderia fasciculata]|eukprot:XP_004350490.1 t-SNARE family protein [Cavenderia fasciculata]